MKFSLKAAEAAHQGMYEEAVKHLAAEGITDLTPREKAIIAALCAISLGAVMGLVSGGPIEYTE